MILLDVPPDEIRTASDRKALAEGYRWSEQAIAHVLAFAATLKDPNDSDRPYRLAGWQLKIVRSLFGWRKPSGLRRFTRLSLWIAKKNGKTSFLAFLALVYLLADGERRPGCYVTSATSEQAEEIYEEIQNLTRGTMWQKLAVFQDYKHRIISPLNGGRFKTLAASAKGAEGARGSFVCLDEIHASLALKPKLYSSLRYAGSGRLQPLLSTISTAGDDRQALPYKIYRRAKRILAGEIEDLHTLAVVYEAPDQDSYTDAELAAANPAIEAGLLTLEQIREDYHEARTDDYSFEDFKRYRLNVWTRRSTAWLDVNRFTPLMDKAFDEAQLAGLTAYVGVDLSSTLDLTAAAIAVPLPDGRVFYDARFWLPADNIAARCLHEMDYLEASRHGYIELVPGQAIDYAGVEAWVEDLAKVRGLTVAGIGFDPWRCEELGGRLEARGFSCWKIRQGWELSEAAHKFHSLIQTARLVHRGNAVLSWCLENVECRTDNNGKIRLIKPSDKRKRIDGIVAAVMATKLSMTLASAGGGFICG